MMDYVPPTLCLPADDAPHGAAAEARDEPVDTIGQLAKRFGITLRALRFYESQGLLAPVRRGQRRFYRRADVDRLTVILKAKRLGFSLAECRQMIADETSHDTLKLSRERCLEQIGLMKRKIAALTEALAELRRICASL
jgi:DNA-binding transcriptional MerR regulator